MVDQQLGQVDLGLGVVQVGGVDQGGDLLLYHLYQRRWAVAEDVDGDAAKEVEILPALVVPDANALTAHKGDGVLTGREGVHVDGAFQRDDVFGWGCRRRGAGRRR